MATRKREYKELDGTPQKRVFLSIINDYDLKTGLCELVDNAIDMWLANGKKKEFYIEIILDPKRQIISVSDNAGGVKEENFESLISPGATSSNERFDQIGVFGVGGKRAGVALGELVEIRSRYKRQKSLQLDITRDWIEADDWKITAFEIPNISPNSTVIEISKLRRQLDDEEVEFMKVHLSEVYNWFIKEGCQIILNESPIIATSFDIWSYPQKFLPKKVELQVNPVGNKALSVRITAGLITDRDPEKENYGVYFYCNHRLVVKEVRTRDVGYFVTSEAGVPHPDASLCRVIVEISGSPSLMPWNSSKSGLNFSHPAFIALRPTLIDLVSFFSKLSRRLKNDWESKVFCYTRGDIETIEDSEIKSSGKLVLPELPRGRSLPYAHRLKHINRSLINDQPWTLGLIEGLSMVDLISKEKLDTRNRAALILLDSNLEIALKEFIVNRDDLFPRKQYSDSRIQSIFQSRKVVISEVKKHVRFSSKILIKINHYYGLRNKLIHERATVGITDFQVRDYRKIVEKILKLLFKVRFPQEN